MSEYEALRTEIERMGTSYVAYASAVDRYAAVVNEQVAALWADNAELRDELHALANRVETLTRARLTEPAETASKMVDYDRPVSDTRGDVRPETAARMIFTCRLNPGCNVSRPHIHADDGAVIFVPDAETADSQLRQRAWVKAVHGGGKS